MNLSEQEKQAIKILSSQDTGQIFFKALMRECGYQMPSVVLTTYGEVEIKGTLYNEARRGIWLNLRKEIDTDKLINIELDEKPKEPITIQKDINHERSNSSNTESNEPADIGGTVRRKRINVEHKSKQFADEYINTIYPGTIDTSDNPDNGGA